MSVQATLVMTGAPAGGSSGSGSGSAGAGGAGDKVPQVFSGEVAASTLPEALIAAVVWGAICSDTGGMCGRRTLLSHHLPPACLAGPRELSVGPAAMASYPLTFRPLAAGAYAGRLELLIPSTGER